MSRAYIQRYKYVYCDPKAIAIFHRVFNEEQMKLKKGKSTQVEWIPDLYPRLMINLKADLMNQILGQMLFAREVRYSEKSNRLDLICVP